MATAHPGRLRLKEMTKSDFCSPTPRRLRRERQNNARLRPSTAKKGSGGLKRNATCSTGRKSDISDSTTSTYTLTSSEESPPTVLEKPCDIEKRRTAEKCMRWMECLPEKFSGMDIVIQRIEYEEDETWGRWCVFRKASERSHNS